MARYMAVYTHRPSMISMAWHVFKLACKLAFALAVLYAYAVIGFSL